MLLIAVAGVVALTASASAAANPLSITTDQGLIPGFSTGAQDYAVRCDGSPLVVSVTDPSGDGVSVDHSSMHTSDFTTSVPLATGQSFSISVRSNGSTTRYHVRCLPPGFPPFSYTRDQTPSPVLYSVAFQSPTANGNQPYRYIAVFNQDGVPGWWSLTPAGAINAALLADGTLAYFDVASNAYTISSLDGSLIRNVTNVHGTPDFHELQLLGNGDYLIGAYVPRAGVDLSPYGGPQDATVLDAEVEEVSPSGQLIWSWNTKDHVSLSEVPQRWWSTILKNGSPYDIVHMNSIDAVGNEIVVSFRQLDAVLGIARSTGDVDWKLGGGTTPQSLTVEADPKPYPLGGQHDARLSADGVLTVYDDRTLLSEAPRALEYQIDETARTATFVGAFGEPDAPLSGYVGSARILSSGNWLVDWGSTPFLGEYSPTGARQFELNLGAEFSYRAVPLPPEVTSDKLEQAMDAQYPRADSNLPPVAAFAPSPGTAGRTIQFDGLSSYDPDGVVTGYHWDFGDGTSGAGATLTHRYASPGDYSVTLTVTDDAGATASVTRSVAVGAAASLPPVAALTVSPRIAPAGTQITFDAASSSAPDGSIATTSWRFGDGATASGTRVQHAFAKPGTYGVAVTVTGGTGLSDTVEDSVRVLDVPPHIRVLKAPRILTAARRGCFRASASSRTGRITAVEWRFGDGKSVRHLTTCHRFGRVRRYRVVFTAWDSYGERAQATRSVTVRRRSRRVARRG